MPTINVETARYVAAIAKIVHRLPADVITDECPECSETVGRTDGYHIAIMTPALDEPVVVVGCGGYWIIDPALVGIDSPNWTPVS